MTAISFKFNKSRLDTPEHYRMKRNNIYWISQTTGWMLFFLLNITAIAMFDTLSLPRALLLFSYCLLALFLTHMYRNMVKKKDWINLPLKKIVPLVLLASFTMGVIIYSIFFVVNVSFNIYEIKESVTGTYIIGSLNTASIIFLWSLIYFSVHLFENYKRAEIESYIWEAAVKDYELKTLKSQLNPHFMFNAMNSIRSLIEEDPESAKTALTRLSNLLRYSLKMERNETVPLEEEIQTVQDYLILEKIRYEERLKYKLDIDPKSSKIEIPPMMIQTLVENGIKHGVSKRTNGGVVVIDTKVSDSKLYIKITNSGHLDEDALKKSEGFGISNTRHRLNLLYGEKSSFVLQNENSQNVSAEIVIPTGGVNNNESFNSR